MSKNGKEPVFTRAFFAHLISDFVVAALLYYFINLNLESQKPMTAAETLKKENYLNAKRDTYIEALDLMYRKLSTLQFHFGDVPSLKPYQRNTGSKPWTELEVNRCLSKLYVYSADPEIPAILESVFGSGNTHAISSLVDFIARIRRDLGDTGQIISHEKFHYIEIPSDSMYSHDSTIQRLLTY